MSKINIVLLILGILFLGFCLFQLNLFKGNLAVHNDKLETDEGYSIPYLFIEDTSKPIATAIITNPNIGSKTVMKRIGETLARIGINSYVIDLPGYGESKIPLDKNKLNNLHTLKSFYDWLYDNNKIIDNQFILVGHSIGAKTNIKATMSKEQLYNNREELGYTEEQLKLHEKYLIRKADVNIIMSAFPKDIITEENLQNAFIMLDGTDFTNKRNDIINFLQNKNKLVEDPYRNIFEGELSKSNKLKIKRYPSVNNLNFTYNQAIINEISEWMTTFYDIDRKTMLNYGQKGINTLFLLGLIIGMVLLIFPLSELLSKLWVFDFKKTKEPYKYENPFLVFIKSIITLVISSVLLMLFVLMGFLQLSITNLVITLFLYQFVLNLLLFRNYIFTSAKYDKQASSKIFLGIIISGMLFLVIGIIGNIYFTRLIFTLDRLWRFAIILIIGVFYFTLDEFLFRTELVFYRISGASYIKSFFLSYIIKLLVITSITLLSLFYFKIEAESVITFISFFTLLFLLMQIFSLYLFKKFKSYFLTGFVNAFMFAWFCSCLPPLVS